MEKVFSVLIPTFNRADILIRTLSALLNQSLSRDDFEVIVINDGSTDDTEEKISDFKKNNPGLDLKYFKQENSGQGIARNLGISKSKGKILVFIGDDIIPDQNFLAEHLKFHQKYSSANHAVLGFIDWHPEINVTPFMKWLTNGSSIFGKFGGHQFAYEKIEGKVDADYNFFYTSNISIKRDIIEDKCDQFDTDFASYGWEDIELGYRLHKKYGLKVFYNKDAIGYHHHILNEDSLKPRMFAIGKSAHIFDSKHPELKKVQRLIKRVCLSILGSLPSLGLIWIVNKLSRNKFQALWFYALSKRYFMKGIAEGARY